MRLDLKRHMIIMLGQTTNVKPEAFDANVTDHIILVRLERYVMLD